MKKVRKAIIPAAGLGTRVLPATKAVPKEMLPIVDKPAIQYIVEEAVAAGIEEILIITSRGKSAVEDHFDRAPELETALEKGGSAKAALLKDCLKTSSLADIFFLRQKEMKGLGHAVLKAKSFTGNEPFVVLYGDDVIMGKDPVAAQLCRAYEEFGKASVGIKEVDANAIQKYSSLKVETLRDNIYDVTDMIEKPAPGNEMSLFSILGRCLLTPEIYDILEDTKPGAGGEIQLTDAMAVLARSGKMTGVDFTGTRYDMGSKLGIMQAQVETALKHKEIGEDFKKYLLEVASKL